MVTIDQFRVSDDGGMLFLDAHVPENQYSTNLYIDYLVIATADQVTESDPSLEASNYIYKYIAGENAKEIHLAITPAETNENFNKSTFSKNLFFVYIIRKGTPAECTPCELDRITTVGVTFDDKSYYQKVMGYTKELADTCNISNGFIDLILKKHAFDAAIETGHYKPAIDFWKQLTDNSYSSKGSFYQSTKGCGCHG